MKEGLYLNYFEKILKVCQRFLAERGRQGTLEQHEECAGHREIKEHGKFRQNLEIPSGYSVSARREARE